MMNSDLLARAEAWLSQDPDPETRAELRAIIDAVAAGDSAAEADLRDRFDTRLTFGTAGLRGELGAGPNRMNRLLVQQAAYGFAQFLLSREAKPSVVIGYDGRVNSEVFARDTAEVMTGAGLNAYVLSDELEGESREVGKVHAALARAAAHGKGPFQKPCVILSGGETTVTIRKAERGAGRSAQVKEETAQRSGDTEQSALPHVRPGRGGRAGEFCLGLAVALQAQPNVWAIAADTDGIDGIEDNAGARVSPDTLARAGDAGVKAADCLDRNDAYGFFEAVGDLVISGPTNTNVNDFRAILVL